MEVEAKPPRFEIKKWNAVAMWSWAICTDTCAICRNNLYEPSIEYQVGSSDKISNGNQKYETKEYMFCVLPTGQSNRRQR